MPFTPNQAFRAEIKALDEHGWPESYRIDLATDADTFYQANQINWAMLFVRDLGTHLMVGDGSQTDIENCLCYAISIINSFPGTKVFRLVPGEREEDEPYFKRIR